MNQPEGMSVEETIRPKPLTPEQRALVEANLDIPRAALERIEIEAPHYLGDREDLIQAGYVYLIELAGRFNGDAHAFTLRARTDVHRRMRDMLTRSIKERADVGAAIVAGTNQAVVTIEGDERRQDPEGSVMRGLIKEVLAQALADRSLFSQNDAIAIELYCALNGTEYHSQREIAAILGVTQGRVGQYTARIGRLATSEYGPRLADLAGIRSDVLHAPYWKK